MIDYMLLGLISLATLIWAFFTLPSDDDSEKGDDGGAPAGGDSSPTNTPPRIASPTPDQDERTTSPGRAPASTNGG